jgi:hypothetical protein
MKNAKLSPNKFETASRDELLRRVLELEDEVERYRPKPPKFKLGQLVAFAGQKNPWMREQPAIYFTVLSLELKENGWHYGHSKNSPTTFVTYPEKKCRELTKTELEGDSNPPEAQPQTLEAQAPGLNIPPPEGGHAY